MKVITECLHLEGHGIQKATLGEFVISPTSGKYNDEGTCLSAGISCDHGCGPIEATHSSLVSGELVRIRPTPVVEPASSA